MFRLQLLSILFISFFVSGSLFSDPAMKQTMETYYGSDKQTSMYMMGSGGVSTLSGAYFLTRDSDFQKGLAIPFIGLGLVQLGIGGTSYYYNESRVKEANGKLSSNPSDFRKSEMEKMEKLKQRNYYLRAAESILLLGGVYAAYSGSQNNDHYMNGMGTGLVIQSAMMLLYDYFADKRTDDYRSNLMGFSAWATPQRGNQEGSYGLGVSFRF
ncbi:MAG: hypothetical protein H7A24_05605 [Leptospiraceae bacterium]|nr:hypothetical protein [Leptospiraceae bacterium]MCP5511334.1 hypothetical protein [Leptospiraceae bacterium]